MTLGYERSWAFTSLNPFWLMLSHIDACLWRPIPRITKTDSRNIVSRPLGLIKILPSNLRIWCTWKVWIIIFVGLENWAAAFLNFHHWRFNVEFVHWSNAGNYFFSAHYVPIISTSLTVILWYVPHRSPLSQQCHLAKIVRRIEVARPSRMGGGQ